MVEYSYKVLAGLPGTGPPPEQFPREQLLKWHEGFVVKFQRAGGSPWVGNFQPGGSSFSGVFDYPDGKSVLVVSGGAGYVVDLEGRKLVASFGVYITGVLPIPERRLLVFNEGDHLSLHGALGPLWRTRRIGWDEIRSLALEGNSLKGEAWSPVGGDHWVPFAVNIVTGESEGGAYPYEK